LKILLCKPDGGAFYYILRGIKQAFELVGHTVAHWDGTEQSLREFKPDLYIGCSGWYQEIPLWARQEYKTKIAYHVNPYGDPIGSYEGGPIIDERQPVIDKVAVQKPDFVFGYFLDLEIRHWKEWRNKLNIPVYGVPTAADHLNFYKVAPNPAYTCDLAFIGGYWQYKAKVLDQYVVPAANRFNTKIYGWGGWENAKIPSGTYGGKIDDEGARVLLSSSKISPSAQEGHVQAFGIDINERFFKGCLCGSLIISDPINNNNESAIHRYFPLPLMPTAANPQNYLELIQYYLGNEEERIKAVAAQRKHVLRYHTYLNRIFTLMAGFKLYDECSKIQSKIEKGMYE
jgi:hypothetical protein